MEKREEKKGKKTWDRYGPVIPCLDFVRHTPIYASGSFISTPNKVR